MAMLTSKIGRKIKEQQGMALALVIIIFSLIMIFTATMVTAVYSDTKLSADDENGKKAYYAARSAVEVVEKAILKNLGELQDLKGNIINSIKNEVDELNENFQNGIPATEEEYEVELDAILASYSGDVEAYKDQYKKFRDYILPGDPDHEYIHTVTIDGFDTESNEFHVVVRALFNEDPDDDILIDGFRLETQATINKKTVTVAKWVGIQIKEGDEILIEALEQHETTDKHVFDEAIYSYGDLHFGPGNGAMAEVVGDITYEGDLYNGNKKIDNPTQANVNVTPYHKTPPTPKGEILEPSSLIPGGVDSLLEKTNTLPQNITPSDSGYYKQNVIFSGDYNVDTSEGDVILKFSSIAVDKDGYKFTISGGHDLYFYLYDEKASGVDFNTDRNSNNETPFSCSGGSNFYFIIDQPEDQRDPNTNVMSFDLGKNKTTMNNVYLYAPFVTISFKNKFDFTGSIVVGGIDIKNNAKVTYHIPSNNPAAPGDLIFVGDQIEIPISGTDSLNYVSGSYWLKK
jgi:hypothetical protein